MLSRTLGDAEASYHKIYEKHGSLMRFLKEMGQPVPDVLRFTAEFVLNNDLKHTFETDPVDFVRDCHAHGNGKARRREGG